MYIFGSNTVKIKIPGVRFSGVLREENEMKRKILAAVFWTMAAASAFAGAEPVPAAEKSEEAIWQKPDMEGIDTENTKIGISIYQFEDTFMTLYRTELVRYLTEELGFKEENILIEDGKNDQDRQTEQVEGFIEDQADVMILNLVHASAAPQITELCSEEGIPVVYINRQPDSLEMERWEQEGIQAAYIGADARQSGIFQGEEIAVTENQGDINGDGEVSYIMIQGEPENIDTQYRTAYSVKALEEAGVEISWVFSENELNKKIRNAEYFVNNQVNAVISLENDDTEKAVEMLFDNEGVSWRIYGEGRSEKTVYYLDKGLIRELVVPNEYYMGYESMVLAAQMARYHTDKMEQVEVDFFRVTKENLYAEETSQILFPTVR